MSNIQAEKYMAMRGAVTDSKPLYIFIKILYKFLPYVLFLGYPALIIYLLAVWDLRFIKVITIPAGTFFTVTIIRYFLNMPRPYEALDITPLFPKDTAGKSFPSRHAASAAIISFAFLYINTFLGVISLFITLVISVLRPIAGVHYVKDVLAGLLLSTLFGIVFFFVL